MRTRHLLVTTLVVLLLGLGFWVWDGRNAAHAQDDWIAPSEGQAKLQGQQLYNQFCASCHGANMQGQFNWRQRMDNGRLPAPPHDESGHTWHHPDWELIQMIQIGFVAGVNAPPQYQSDMPGFESVLDLAQIESILAYIKTYWPDEILEAQREISVLPHRQAHQ
jgi:mono/diheme cytochrome c family protein